MTKTWFYWAIMAFSLLFFVACSDEDDDDEPTVEQKGKFEDGALIINEGQMGQNNASISFLDFTKDTLMNAVYNTENHKPLGDLLQCIAGDGANLYLVLNATNKIEVVDKDNLTSKGEITNLIGPRTAALTKGKVYVSLWGSWIEPANKVVVIDTSSYQVTKEIPVGAGPEGLLVKGNNLLVANGGYATSDSTVSIIDLTTNEVTQSVKVGFNPKEFALDKNGDIWVVCQGIQTYGFGVDVPGSIVQLSSTDYSVKKKLDLPEGGFPAHIDISKDGQKIYYGAGYGFSGIYELDITATELPNEAFIAGDYYGFNINPENGDIYCCKSPTYTDSGTVTIFTATGTVVKNYNVGVAPNGVYFQ